MHLQLKFDWGFPGTFESRHSPGFVRNQARPPPAPPLTPPGRTGVVGALGWPVETSPQCVIAEHLLATGSARHTLTRWPRMTSP